MAYHSMSTLFVNQTRNVVKMRVGNSRSSSHVASLAGSGGQFRMHVNLNDTYREFLLVGVGVDGDGARGQSSTVVVISDDFCDFQCITITELADGTIDLLRQPRQLQPRLLHHTFTSAGKLDRHSTVATKVKSWFTWKMWV